MNENGMSFADVKAITDNDGALGGNGLWLLIILFFLMMGGNYGRADGFGQYATSASQQEILFGQQFQALDNKIDRTANGIADATYALNNQIQGNALQNANNFATVNGNIASEGRQLQCQINAANLENQKNVDALRYDMATLNDQTKELIHAEGEATRSMLQQNKIETLQAQVNQLQMQQALCGIPKVNTNAWGVYQYPTQCGCNCGNI